MKKRKQKKSKDHPIASDGEPILIDTTEFDGDVAPIGILHHQCCDCKLKHIMMFQVIEGGIILRTVRVE